MSYQLLYHPDVKRKDLYFIPVNIKTRIRNAIEQRLLVSPIHYGEPLRKGLKGYRKLRVGDYRIIYVIDRKDINILKIGHRKDVYNKIYSRI